MLFNSVLFCCIFLPLVFFGFWLLKLSVKRNIIIGWLIACSLVFYAWWYPPNTFILMSSILVNFLLGKCLQRASPNKIILVSGVLFNLLIISIFKYGGFFMTSIGLGSVWHGLDISIALPLAISFYTFQQITYLVDSYKGKIQQSSALDYILYVTFFPQLIAGPIVHHSDVMAQFKDLAKRYDYRVGACGFILFALGLSKKVLFADAAAEISSPVFDAAHLSMLITAEAGWSAALGYTLQLYFDFSGYSDMAIGLGLIFNIVLPTNFNSPYKAKNISDFWRRWHITLSNFLRDYLYIPLGGNRKGSFIRYRNLLITMLLGGLWHGAGLAFMAWGLWHGLLLCMHQLWSRSAIGQATGFATTIIRVAAWPLTMLVVIIGWVLFKAENFGVALIILEAMFVKPFESDIRGYSFYDDYPIIGGLTLKWFILALLLTITLLFPNTSKIISYLKKQKSVYVSFVCGLAIFLVLFCLLINLSRAGSSEFIYFNF